MSLALHRLPHWKGLHAKLAMHCAATGGTLRAGLKAEQPLTKVSLVDSCDCRSWLNLHADGPRCMTQVASKVILPSWAQHCSRTWVCTFTVVLSPRNSASSAAGKMALAAH